jgi:hypothetical protein
MPTPEENLLNPQELRRVNHYLGIHGLPQMDTPEAVVEALAFLVKDEAEFRKVLNKCEPRWRHEMYEALRPRLSFQVKPLDVYVAEMGMDAAARKLPTIGPDGKLEEYKVPEVNTELSK